MKRVLSLFAISAFALAVATPAMAAKGSLTMSWGTCPPAVQNLNFTGPGQVATLVVSALGADEAHKGYRAKVLVGMNLSTGLPDAWRFDAAGCQTGQLSINVGGLSKACPSWSGTNPLPIFNYAYEVDKPNTATLDVLNAYDVATPVAGTPYTVLQAKFDHAFSDTGPQDPLIACGNAENIICFWLFDAKFLRASDLVEVPFDGFTTNFTTWNDAGNTNGCPTVQNENSTWGRVKGLYR